MEAILLDQVRCIQEHKPAFVIGDFAPTLKMAAEITGTKIDLGYQRIHEQVLHTSTTDSISTPRRISSAYCTQKTFSNGNG